MAKRSSPKNGKSPPARPYARKRSRKSKPVQSATAKTKRSQNTPHGEASSNGIERAEGLVSAYQAILEPFRELTEEEEVLDSLNQALRVEIGMLTEQAEAGDHEALARLLKTAGSYALGLNKVKLSNPDALKPLLAKTTVWPILITNNDVLNTTRIAELRKLGFGSDVSTGHAAIFYYARTPTVASMIASTLCNLLELGRILAVLRQEINVALELASSVELASSKRIKDGLQKLKLKASRKVKFGWEAKFKSWGKPLNDEDLESMLEECSKLPPLSGASWKAWFAVARKVFMHLTDGRPEEIQTLQAIGGLIFDPIDKKLKFQGQEYRPSKERGKVRDRIVTSIRYAFKIKAAESGLKP